MKLFIVSFVALSLIGSGMSSASAATVNVAPGLSNTDIQAIIDGAQTGDTIQFLGNYYENISLVINKTCNLVAAPTGTLIKAISNSSYIPANVIQNSISNTAAFYFINGTNGDGKDRKSVV